MQKIHSDSGDVLLHVSPLIDFRKSKTNGAPEGTPLHVRARDDAARRRQTELSPIHDFMSKLLQPSVVGRLAEYVRWQAAWREGYANGLAFEEALATAPDYAPLSINLDLTTACNYRCDHCVDMDILNTGIRYDHDRLKDALSQMADKGLRSVILIGGGEPTAYPGFGDVVRHLKERDIQIGVVTNGSLMKKIGQVADAFGKGDWVRLSLDSATNETFRAMHKPVNKKCTLDWICEQIPPIKDANPGLQIGFSYIIVWRDCHTNDADIVENVAEIEAAAARAKRYRFDYISLKPFLTRAEENNAEIVDLVKDDTHVGGVMEAIREQIALAKRHEDAAFKVIESTNLRVLENGSYKDYTEQPHNCHMQFFRQVVSPLGVFNCPVYRHVPQALIGGKHAYATDDAYRETRDNVLRLIEAFDAAAECKDVTCLYNHANWFIEDLIRNPHKLESLTTADERRDYFL